MRRSLLTLSLAVGGCFDPADTDPEVETEAGTSATTGSGPGTSADVSSGSSAQTTAGSCQTPADGCPCAGGACEEGLTCIEGVCTACGNGEVEHTEECDGTVPGGSCELCMVVCDGSHADCDGDPATCETDLTSTSTDCGDCGRDCQGGECAAGKCQPIILASNQGEPLGIDVRDGFVYWANQAENGVGTGRIMRHSTEPGGAPEILADGLGNPERLIVDDTHVYWGNVAGGGVGRVLHDGSGLEAWLPSEASPKRLADAGDTVLWAVFATNGEIRKSAKDLANATLVVTAQSFPVGIAVDGNYVYWTTRQDGFIRRADFTADPVVVEDLANGQLGPYALVIRGETMYWVNEGSQASGFLDGEVKARSITGGQETIFSPAEPRPRELVVDDNHVYWVSRVDAGAVRRAALDTLEVEDLADAQLPGGIAQDDTAIYFTEQAAGRVSKLPK